MQNTSIVICFSMNGTFHFHYSLVRAECLECPFVLFFGAPLSQTPALQQTSKQLHHYSAVMSGQGSNHPHHLQDSMLWLEGSLLKAV